MIFVGWCGIDSYVVCVGLLRGFVFVGELLVFVGFVIRCLGDLLVLVWLVIAI